jgi:4-diphosphocytidyl-2-C-methyl-D-erythritol kinase
MTSAGLSLTTRCRAKINLTLRVLGRRPDGYHELESLVAFAGMGDALTLEPGPELGLTLAGPFGDGLAAEPDNLVLRAAHALATEAGPLRSGRFHLVKRLPLASGIGGGSADAAGALRLLARLNGIAADDPVLIRVAEKVGADVPVCLASRARTMSGLGEVLGPPLALPPLFAVLVNPGVAVATASVFRALAAPPLDPSLRVQRSNSEGLRETLDCFAALAMTDHASATTTSLIAALTASANDLEAPAGRLAPAIADVLQRLEALPGCRLARMSGSGATCFVLFDDCRASVAAAKGLARAHPDWWIRPTLLR